MTDQRDARMALHSPTADPVEGDESVWAGEDKLAGPQERRRE